MNLKNELSTADPKTSPRHPPEHDHGPAQDTNTVHARVRSRRVEGSKVVALPIDVSGAARAVSTPRKGKLDFVAIGERGIRALPAAALGYRDTYRDPSVPGLTLRVTAGGAKSWTIERWHEGRSWKWQIGVFPAMGFERARVKALDALVKLEDGRDPRQEERERVAAAVAKRRGGHVIDDLVEPFLSRIDKHGAGATWLKEQGRQFRRDILPRWKERAVESITSEDVARLTDKIAERSRVQANRTFGTLRSFFKWCAKPPRRYITAPPTYGLDAPGGSEPTRDRVLDDAELRKVWDAARDVLAFPYAPIIRLAILCGVRRSEVTGVCARDVNLAERVWTLPHPKQKRPHKIPLAPMALSIFKSVLATPSADGSADRYVFPTGQGARVEQWEHALDIISRETGVSDWRGHDLRRSVASIMVERLGITPDVADACLGHTVASKVRRAYQIVERMDAKAAAFTAWERHLRKIGCKL
jgi:integrase